MAEVARFHGGPRVRRRDCGSAKGAFSCPMMTYRADRTAPMLLTRCGAKRKEAARRHASRRPPRWMQCISSPPPPNERLAPMPTHVEREGLGKDWRIDPRIFQRYRKLDDGLRFGAAFHSLRLFTVSLSILDARDRSPSSGFHILGLLLCLGEGGVRIAGWLPGLNMSNASRRGGLAGNSRKSRRRSGRKISRNDACLRAWALVEAPSLPL